MFVLRRWPQAHALDAWIKVPSWMRSDDGALGSVIADVSASIQRRLPGARLTKRDRVGQRSLLWPIFDADQASFSPLKSPNFFFDAPDLWPSLDWLGRFRFENGIVETLEKMKAKWDEAARKLAERNAKA